MIDFNIDKEQKQGLILVFILTVGIAGFYFLNSRPSMQPALAPDLTQGMVQEKFSESPVDLIINVAGKVNNPGVYQLPQGSRVIDAIKAAGNQRNGVDISDINLARVLVDGEQILVGSPKPSSGKAATKKITIDNPLI